MSATAPEKRVAIVTPTFPPYRGGIGRIAQLDAHAFATLGWKVDVYTPNGPELSEKHDFYEVRSAHPWFRYGLAAFCPALYSTLTEYPLVVLHYPFFGGAEPIALAKFLLRKNAGALFLEYHMDVVGKGVTRMVSAVHDALIMPQIIDAADRVIVTSRDYAKSGRLYQVMGERSQRFIELPPAVDVERLTPGPASPELLKKYGLDPARPRIVFLGGLDKAHYFKGINVLLRAAASKALEGADVVIIGNGDLLPSYQKMADDLGIRNRVVFASGVSDAELAGHLRLGTVFAFPSTDKSEAFGVAALEAMACGLPVVASDLPGVRTIVKNGQTGFLVPCNDADALTARLAEVIGDPQLRERLSAAVHSMVAQSYSEQIRIARWSEIIEGTRNGGALRI